MDRGRPAPAASGPDAMTTTVQWGELLDFQAERLERLELLVRWLAMPYGENRPIFATELPNGVPLESGAMLEALYTEVVGPKEPTRGAWFRCPTCSMWQIRSDPVETLGIVPGEIPAAREPATG
jgi:hypothetical protein